MKKFIFYGICASSLLWFFSISDLSSSKNFIVDDTAKAATTGNVSLSGTVLEYIALTFTSGSAIVFGNITPGTDACNGSGTVASVITNAANGYTIGLSDGSATNSAMRHTDTTTYITDMIGTFTTPTAWATGSTTGVGVTLFAADTTKETKWGTGTTACVYENKWAGVPLAATTGHTVTGYRAGADTTSWGWKVNVPNTQKTGMYTGNVLFTSAAVLS